MGRNSVSPWMMAWTMTCSVGNWGCLAGRLGSVGGSAVRGNALVQHIYQTLSARRPIALLPILRNDVLRQSAGFAFCRSGFSRIIVLLIDLDQRGLAAGSLVQRFSGFGRSRMLTRVLLIH